MQAELEEEEERVARQREEEAKLISWDNIQAMMELIDKRKKHFAKLRAKEIRRKPPTKAQMRNQMCTYLRNMANYKHSQLKNKSFKEIQMLYDNTMKWIDSFVPIDSELEDDSKKEKIKLCLEIVLKDDEAVNVESLATKYPIVDWKTHILAEDKMYYEIIRADGNLITLYEPSEEDEIWKAQQDYTLISWRLFDSCGVHLLLMDTGIAIHMLVERKYPLTQEMLSRMLSEIQMLFDNTMKWVDSFVPMDSEVVKGSKSQAEGSKKRTRKELDEESVKRQKLEDDAEKAELKACLEIVPDDDSAVNVESLATKYPIVDWKTHILAEDKMADRKDLRQQAQKDMTDCFGEIS
ncbi:hypothetical protein Tco_0618199 [Tanacetum coccineum]